jgi:hypothetical protein
VVEALSVFALKRSGELGQRGEDLGAVDFFTFKKVS